LDAKDFDAYVGRCSDFWLQTYCLAFPNFVCDPWRINSFIVWVADEVS
jgi:hypothetical protein